MAEERAERESAYFASMGSTIGKTKTNSGLVRVSRPKDIRSLKGSATRNRVILPGPPRRIQRENASP